MFDREYRSANKNKNLTAVLKYRDDVSFASRAKQLLKSSETTPYLWRQRADALLKDRANQLKLAEKIAPARLPFYKSVLARQQGVQLPTKRIRCSFPRNMTTGQERNLDQFCLALNPYSNTNSSGSSNSSFNSSGSSNSSASSNSGASSNSNSDLTQVLLYLDKQVAAVATVKFEDDATLTYLSTVRGYGFGPLMLRYVEEHARKLGCKSVIIWGAVESAREFYVKQGYVPYGNAADSAFMKRVETQKRKQINDSFGARKRRG